MAGDSNSVSINSSSSNEDQDKMLGNHDETTITPLQKYVMFFDQNNDGIVYPSETFKGFRAIGLDQVCCCHLRQQFSSTLPSVAKQDLCNYINFRRNVVCLKCDHRRYIVPQQMGNKMKSHQTQRQQLSLHGKQIGNESGRSWKFVENVREHHQDSVSWYEENGFMIFPAVGGESDLSQNLDKQELWKKQMTSERSSSSNPDHVKEDEGRYQYPKFLDRCQVASGDDEEDTWLNGLKVQEIHQVEPS